MVPEIAELLEGEDDVASAVRRGPACSASRRAEASEWELSRRDFVKAAGAVAGAAALGASTHAIAEATDSQVGAVKTVSTVLKINGSEHTLALDPRTSLLDVLREKLQMTGTKKGCDHGQCGACTVLANGRRINSCLSLAVTHSGDEITTIEGLARGEELHAMQAAFLEHDGLQCGYCTPGQICSAVALLEEAKHGAASVVTEDLAAAGAAHLTADEIRERMSGNICRCGAYPGIVKAVQMVYGRA